MQLLLPLALLALALNLTAAKIVNVVLVASSFPNLRPDGVNYTMLLFNGTLPGPTIYATEGDTLRVRLINRLNEPTTVHFHGVVQKDSIAFDGVPWITQCALQRGSSMTYTFLADSAGTYWYHSHFEIQRGSGLYGMLVVAPKEPDPYASLYDEERQLVVADHFHHSMMRIFHSYAGALPPRIGQRFLTPGEPKIPPADVNGGVFVLTSMLANGRYKFNCSQLAKQRPEPGTNCVQSAGGYSVIRVKQGKRYRIRGVGAGFAMEFTLSIDAHDLTVIAADGSNVQPLTGGALELASGETFDFVVAANQPIGRYWLRACIAWYNCHNNTNALPLAILEYEGADPSREPTSLHTQRATIHPMQLRPATGQPAPPAVASTLVFNSLQEWEMNGTVFREPPRPLVYLDNAPLRQYSWASFDGYVTLPIYSQPLGTATLIIFNNRGNFTHPMHIHGHLGWLLGLGLAGDGPFDPRKHKLRTDSAIRKHSFNTQPRSWAAMLYVADNPGWHLFHCHIDFHMMVGMSVVLRDYDPKNPNANIRMPAGMPTWCIDSSPDRSFKAEHITLIVLAVSLFTGSLICLACAFKRTWDDKHKEQVKQPFLESQQLRSDAA